VVLKTRQDRPCRSDRELLASHLEDERPEPVERRKFVHPGSWTEIRALIDQRRENRVGLPKELSGRRIRDSGSCAACGSGVHRVGCGGIHGCCSFLERVPVILATVR
jgi:hypothetical protein